MIKIFAKFILLVLAILAVAEFVPGISVDGLPTTLVVAVVLSVINLTLRPVLFVLTLPVTILTLGLFSFVLNALMLWLASLLIEGFVIESFLSAFLGALIIAVIHWVGNRLL